MVTKIVRFLSLFFVALALGGSLAHLYALGNKIHLGPEDYLTVQQVYRGWALLGIPVFGALVSTVVLAVLVRRTAREFVWTLFAIACLAGTQVIFWMFTYPTNQQTLNWTVLPADWPALRARWEYSHAVGAALNMAAHSALVISVLVARRAGGVAAAGTEEWGRPGGPAPEGSTA
jgi:hypothetical protein